MDKLLRSKVHDLGVRVSQVTGSPVPFADIRDALVAYAVSLVENDFSTFLRCYATRQRVTKEKGTKNEQRE